MKIAVLGTGMVGDTIGSRLIELGHEVKMGSRTADNEKAKAFAAKHGDKASAGTFADAAAFGELIVNCTAGAASVAALKMAGEANLDGKIIVDIANPLDFSNGAPPSLIPSLSNTHSLAEEIQNTFPSAKVVKTLNTMWCGLMVNPSLVKSGDHTNFICGNDADAKQKVKALLQEFGWKNENLLDLGGHLFGQGNGSRITHLAAHLECDAERRLQFQGSKLRFVSGSFCKSGLQCCVLPDTDAEPHR